jgi:hypothetical protein
MTSTRLANPRPCEWCGAAFFPISGRARSRRFCSQSCDRQSRRTEPFVHQDDVSPRRIKEIAAECRAALAGFDHELELIEQRAGALVEEVPQ